MNRVLSVVGSAVFGRGVDGSSSAGFYIGSYANSTHYNWEVSTQKVIDGGFEIARSVDPGSPTFLNPFFVLSRDGNLGIGEPYPSDKLVVSGNATITGTLRANEVIVNSGFWADYVFEPGYSLRKLDSITMDFAWSTALADGVDDTYRLGLGWVL